MQLDCKTVRSFCGVSQFVSNTNQGVLRRKSLERANKMENKTGVRVFVIMNSIKHYFLTRFD